MKHITAVAALVCTLPVALAQDPPPPPANYVVHEWGTFTSMVGRGGTVLEGLQREEESLPPFVHDLLKVDEFDATDSKMPASRVTQKMETPVIYFHSDEALRVRVGVWFDKGLMTQFYPLPAEVYPLLADARKQRLDMRTIDGSSLHWDVELVPRSQPLPPEIPKVAAEHPWAIARQVDAACVRTVTAGTPARAEAEHYLFYRGLGRSQPPVELGVDAAGTVRFKNGMAAAIPFCAVLELGEQGGRFVLGKEVGPGLEQEFGLGAVPFEADRERLSRRLGAAVQHALEQTGLYQDEARAMVATWSRSWFQSDGARVIYLLPRAQTDAMLPIWFEPRPKDLVRTMVARLEFITHAAQARIEQALRDQEAGTASRRAAAAASLQHLDRFLEPHLRNIADHGSDALVRERAERLLAAMAR